MKYIFIIFFLTYSFVSKAHEGHHHGVHTQAAKLASTKPDLDLVYAEINKNYQTKVKPIFDQKCADCHSAENSAPWYSAIPFVHRLVESDRSEAKEHLEISKGFPFAGHGTPEEDLNAIKDVLKKGSMPTRLYRLMHPSSELTAEERNLVMDWVKVSELKIKSAQAPEKSK